MYALVYTCNIEDMTFHYSIVLLTYDTGSYFINRNIYKSIICLMKI